ncbi:MAG: NAD-dependent epimerase/dehydratase family protein [Bacteroidetes bacterium]|nr:NAD-dependent epimerase/dehydratase family protein [Bacteroidota bacterium]
MKEIKKILVTGSVGQIGSELTLALREKYGAENVIATGRKTEPSKELKESGPFHFIDVNAIETVEEMIRKYEIDTIVHMAAILSAVGEKNPTLAWDVNMNGTLNILNLGVKYEMARVIIPSSIAVWGPGTPSVAPQDTALHPTTMYGVTKVCGEVLADYYVKKYGLDSRGLRYPGIISSETLPGGGTTDYAVAIYYEAVKNRKYTCFVREDTRLPMMYMPDCLKATIDLMEAPFENLKRHNDYNVGSMSFTAKELAESIRKVMPDFVDEYEPDFRQDIADSWPDAVDDSAAREDWGWNPSYDLDSMTKDMLQKLHARHERGEL